MKKAIEVEFLHRVKINRRDVLKACACQRLCNDAAHAAGPDDSNANPGKVRLFRGPPGRNSSSERFRGNWY